MLTVSIIRDSSGKGDNVHTELVVILRTERLLILAFPTDQELPDLRRKSDIRDVLKRHAEAEKTDHSQANALLQAQQHVRCVCLCERDGKQVGAVTSNWDKDAEEWPGRSLSALLDHRLNPHGLWWTESGLKRALEKGPFEIVHPGPTHAR